MKKMLVVLLAGLFLFTVGCSGKSVKKTVKVPSIVNLKLDAAEKTLEKEGLILQVVSSKYSETVPLDFIISQTPLPGEKVREGTIVKAVISNGSKNVTVPNLVGKSFEDAVSILQSIGLSVGDISEKEDKSPVGTILSQSPKDGTLLPPNSDVKLTVSLGQFVTMPNVIGMHVNDAKALLEKDGFRISHIDVDKSLKVYGNVVLYQYPMPGLKVRQGVEVRLKVSQ